MVPDFVFDPKKRAPDHELRRMASCSHHHRGARLEWVIVLLFVFEILFSLYEKFIGGGP